MTTAAASAEFGSTGTITADPISVWLAPADPSAEQPARRHWWQRLYTSAWPWLVIIAAGQVVQTRRSNFNKAPFEDEALYIYMGHRMIAHVLHGDFVREYPGSYFSGAPGLYPIFAALGDSVNGVDGARDVSLIFAIVTMIGVYGIGRELFGKVAGVVGAAAFSLAGSVVYLSHWATYDSCMMAFVALAAWLCVWSAKRDALKWAPAVAVLLTLAFYAKYAGAAYVPVVSLLGAAVGWPQFGRLAVRQAAVVAVGSGALIFAVLCTVGRSLMDGVRSTTITRTILNYGSTHMMLDEARSWIGLWILLGLLGALWIRTRADLLVSLALGIGAVIGVGEQIRIHELTSFSKHVAFGLIFACPLVGKLFALLLRRRLLIVKAVGAAAVVAVFAIFMYPSGVTNAKQFLTFWPQDQALVPVIAHYQQRYPNKHILGESPAPEKYALMHRINPALWNDTYQLFYKKRVGEPAYRLAIKQDHYGLIYLTDGTKYGRLVQSILDTHQTDYRYLTKVPRVLRGQTVGYWVIYGLRRATDGH